MSKLVVEFNDLVENDVDIELIGKKAGTLYELIQLGIPIPDGFVINHAFFKEFYEKTGICEDLIKVQSMKHPALGNSFAKLFEPIQKKIMRTHIPRHLASELHGFYRKLAGVFKESALNIYSSVKEGKSIAFYDTKGDANLILKIKTLLAYYLNQPFSVIVQTAVKSESKKSIISDDSAVSDPNLLKLAKKIQKHFYFPQEIEYFIEKGKIFVTGVKPFTGIVKELKKEKATRIFKKSLIRGIAINMGVVTGPVKLINSYFVDVKKSEIAVIKNLDKSLFNKMKIAKGIIADSLFQSSIDRLSYRERIKSPTITGAQNSTKLLQNGDVVTLNGTTGEIYSGGLT